jgi:hypothetical protein
MNPGVEAPDDVAGAAPSPLVAASAAGTPIASDPAASASASVRRSFVDVGTRVLLGSGRDICLGGWTRLRQVRISVLIPA